MHAGFDACFSHWNEEECNTMPNIIRRKSWASMAAALCAGALSALTIGPAAADNSYGVDYFPNVALTTQDGKTVKFYDDLLKGKSVAINVMYTSCKDECPLETAKMAQVQRIFGDKMGKDIFFYSISIDPKHDTPKVLKAYTENFDVGPGWLFLTGKEADIKLVVKKLGLSRSSDSDNKDGHSASLMIGNEPTGQWMRHSAVDNPRFLAASIGSFLGWRGEARLQTSYTEARPLVLEQGQYLFQSRCGACHTVGQGDKIGPDLLDVTARRKRDWLTRYLIEPDKMRAEGDPIATALSKKYQNIAMPNQSLGGADLTAMLSYLETRSSAARDRAPPGDVQTPTHTHVHAPSP
jgi:protein SCO1/2